MNDVRLIASWVAQAMGGTLTGDRAREFSGVSIDTRTLEPGALFIAIRGERFDGAQFVGVAEPDVRVWTNVGEAHVGFFASIDAIADAKAEIFERASRATLLVANA